MFGYVQSRTSSDWIQKVNIWIKDLSENNVDLTIDWTDNNEYLIQVDTFSQVQKFSSSHFRKIPEDRIILWHYLIELVPKN
jgi:hypothetical protein